MENLYAKICHEDGVVFEKKFNTEYEAHAFVEGFNEAKFLLCEERTHSLLVSTTKKRLTRMLSLPMSTSTGAPETCR